MTSKRLGYIAAWLAVTALATAASFAAVDLVGATTAAEPSASVTFPTSTTLETPSTSASTSTTGGVISTIESTGGTTTTTNVSATSVTSATTISPPDTTVGTTTATTIADTTTSTTGTPTTTVPPETGPFSYASEGGTVTISCLGDEISLNGAIPSSGFAVEIKDSGPDEVRVEFRTDETEIEVRVECEAGIPDVEISGP